MPSSRRARAHDAFFALSVSLIFVASSAHAQSAPEPANTPTVELAPMQVTAEPEAPPLPGQSAASRAPNAFVPGDPDAARAPSLAGVLRYQADQERRGRFAGTALVVGIGTGFAAAGVIGLLTPNIAHDSAAAIEATAFIVVGVSEAVAGGIVALIPGLYERMWGAYRLDLAHVPPGDAFRRALTRWQMESERQRSLQSAAAFLDITVGAGAMVVGGIAVAEASTFVPTIDVTLGAFLLVLGGMDIALGIGQALVDPAVTQTLRAYRQAAGLEGPGVGQMVMPRRPPLPQLSIAPLPGGAAGTLALRF